MNTAALRELIQRALQNEVASSQLTRILEAQVASLHPAIRLPEEDAQGVLARFIAAYVEQVPDVLDAAANVAREAGIEARIRPVLRVAEQFFLQPPALMAGHEGLEGLLDEAYLAHRLVEEVNDRYILHFGQPLDLSDFAGEQAGENTSREVLMRAMKAIAELAGELNYEPQIAGRGWKPTAEELASDMAGSRRRRRRRTGKQES